MQYFKDQDDRHAQKYGEGDWRGIFILCCGKRARNAGPTIPDEIEPEFHVHKNSCFMDTSKLYSDYPELKVRCPPIADPHWGVPLSYKCTHEYFKSFMDSKDEDGRTPRSKFIFSRREIKVKQKFVKKLYPTKEQMNSIKSGHAKTKGIQQCMYASYKRKGTQCIYQRGSDPLIQDRKRNGAIRKTSKTNGCDLTA